MLSFGNGETVVHSKRKRLWRLVQRHGAAAGRIGQAVSGSASAAASLSAGGFHSRLRRSFALKDLAHDRCPAQLLRAALVTLRRNGGDADRSDGGLEHRVHLCQRRLSDPAAGLLQMLQIETSHASAA